MTKAIKDCITELVGPAYLMIGHSIDKLRNSLNNSVKEHISLMSSYICNLANAQGGSVSKKLWSFIKQQKMIIVQWHPSLQDNGVTYRPLSVQKIIAYVRVMHGCHFGGQYWCNIVEAPIDKW